MQILNDRSRHDSRRHLRPGASFGRYGAAGWLAVLTFAWAGLAGELPTLSTTPQTNPNATKAQLRFPTVAPEHPHVRALLENAMRYVAPENGMTDASSGYPVEGWNQDPGKGLFLRSFTQLTATGESLELLANVVAGYADTPFLSREEALARLILAVKSLRHDQHDPQLSDKGLLGNFLDLNAGRRRGPLAADVEQRQFRSVFGDAQGKALWQALKTKGWIVAQNDDRKAVIRRDAEYGWNSFTGPLAPYRDDTIRRQVMAILDQRVVLVAFGDNANLSTSVAKTVGTLLLPEMIRIRDNPSIKALCIELERFLDDQRDGYAALYDAKAGLFYFGWNATKNCLVGWDDVEGRWQTGHMDYLVNEFRDPATFVALRYGVPADAIANLGFKIKPYRMQDGTQRFVLAPWEGSAFQALGLGLSMMELNHLGWRTLLENVVDVEIDFARRYHLPGFLSESYTGQGLQYTGDVGIPEITVNPKPRITDAASLYTLGVAYRVAPAKIERFLAANWPVISKLQTDHGPWEGFNVTKQQPIEFQTSAHTLALILGILGTGPDSMQRYLDFKRLSGRLAEFDQAGPSTDLLGGETAVFAWADRREAIRSTREQAAAFRVQGTRAKQLGIAFVSNRSNGVNLSNGALTLRYRCLGPMNSAVIAFKPAASAAAKLLWIPKELFIPLADTRGQEQEIQVPLPATPGLVRIKEVVFTWRSTTAAGQSVDLTITRLAFTPYRP
jgi:hypothetical protein